MSNNTSLNDKKIKKSDEIENLDKFEKNHNRDNEKEIKSETDKNLEARTQKIKWIIPTSILLILLAIYFFTRETPVENIILSKDNIEIRVGEKESLTYTLIPNDATNQEVEWTSNDDTIAIVNHGEILGITEGSTDIIVKSKNNKQDIVKVLVKSAKPDLKKIYHDDLKNKYANLAVDGSYLSIDTNPLNLKKYMNPGSIEAIKIVNKSLKVPDSVIKKILRTRALDGVQTYETDDLEISWTYHPNNGLEIIYMVKE